MAYRYPAGNPLHPEALKEKQRALRDGFSTPLTLRVHRALSWLRRAEAEQDDQDVRFILLWIGFNAAYAGDVEASASSSAPEGERGLFQSFFSTLVKFDGRHRVYDAVWQRFSQEIRLLLDNRYVYHPFWQHQNGAPGYEDCEHKLERGRIAINHALREHDTVRIHPLIGWTLDRTGVTRTGAGLTRPECVLAQRDGCLWAADGSGGITRIDPDGTCRLIRQRQSGVPLEHAEPNGFAICPDGSFMLADRGRGELQHMSPEGEVRVLADAIEGRSLEQINFVLLDHAGRVWITVQTTAAKTEAGRADGFIARYEEGSAWIAAEGFDLANECCVDARGEWLYVVESTGRRITRLPIRPDGTLGERETFGPETLGPGFPDGMSFDAAGNLWIAMVLADRLVALTPDGEVLQLADFGDAEATALMEEEFAALGMVTAQTLQSMTRRGLDLITSVTFGGPDLKTAYLGSLAGSSLITFRSPVAGLALSHWRRS